MKEKFKGRVQWYHILFSIGFLLAIIVWFQDFSEYKISFSNILYSNLPFKNLSVKVKGPHLSDPLDQMMQQAYIFMISGRPFSMWNSYNSFGYAITCWDILLSPFNWFYILGLDLGQLLKYILKYILAFWGMFFFLKNKKLHIISSVGGGITFCCSSSIILWGGWPHSDVISLAPWAFYCADKIIEYHFIKNFLFRNYYYLWFCGIIYLMLVAGMSTYAAYFIYLGIFYVLYQLRSNAKNFAEFTSCFLYFSTAIILAGIMSFFYNGSLFLETLNYQQDRTTLAFSTLDWTYLKSLFFPYLREDMNIHINESCLFTGFLWILTIPVYKKISKYISEIHFWWLLSLMLFLFIFTYNTGYLYQFIPLINTSVKMRLLVILNFSFSVLGAIGLDYIFLTKSSHREKKYCIIAYTLLLFAIFFIFIDKTDLQNLKENYQIYAYSISLILVIVGAIICIMGFKPIGSSCILLSSIFIGALFARDYIPLINRDAEIIPNSTETINFISENTSDDFSRIVGKGWILFPNTNQYYFIRDIRGHGFMVTDEETKNYYQRINSDVYFTPTFLLFPEEAILNKNLLAYSSVKYILSSSNKLSELDNAIKKANTNRNAVFISEKNQRITQTFTASQNDLSSINILLSTNKHILDKESYLNIEICEQGTEIPFFRESVCLAEIQDDSFLSFRFDPLSDSLGKRFQLTLQLSNSVSDPLAVWITEASYLDGSLSMDGSLMAGDLCFVPDYGRKMLFNDGVEIEELKNYCPRAYTVDIVSLKDSKDAILDAMSTDFDVKTVFTENGVLPDALVNAFSNTSDENLTSNINWIQDDGDYILLDTQSNKSSLLVLTDRYDKDWHAFVDGKETEIYNVNYLFKAIELPEGNHTVEFRYKPITLYLFFAISIIGYLVFIGLVIFVIWSKKRISSTKKI